MGGEHRSDVERAQRARHRRGRMPGLAQASQRPAHRAALRRRLVVLAGPAHPMGLFRGVDQNEEHREGTRREARRLGVQRARPGQQRVQVRRPRHAEPSGAAGPAQLLYRVQRVLAGQAADHPPQGPGEPAHVLAQRRVLRARDRRRQRNGGGNVGGGGGHGRDCARMIAEGAARRKPRPSRRAGARRGARVDSAVL